MRYARLISGVAEPPRTENSQEPVNWYHVAQHIPGRSNKDCRKRWHNVVKGQLDGSIKKGHWRDDEDQQLRRAVQTHGAS